MNAKTKRRIIGEDGDVVTSEDMVIGSLIGNGEDLSPLVRHAFELGHIEPLLQQLKHVARKKEVEIEDLCRVHYEEFIIAVDELRGVVVDAEELKSRLQTNNFKLQEVGGGLLSKLDELLELFSIKKNINEAIRMCKMCFQLLEFCSKCNAYVSEGKFYPALKTLELIEMKYLKNTPVKALRSVFIERIPIIKSHIEKKVCVEVNEWLVHIRSLAKDIGQMALRHSATSKKKDEDMLVRQREIEAQSHLILPDSMYTLDIDVVEEDLCLEIDLTPIYRAYHIHKSLGLGERFREYYYNNRLAQLNSDLQIISGQPFNDCHKNFLEQIAGHFIVEDRVLRTAEGLLDDNQVETMWETAVSMISSISEEQFSVIDNATDLVLLKDYLTLFGVTMRQHGYEVTSLFEAMSSTTDKFGKLLMKQCEKEISDIVVNDNYEPMLLKKESDYHDVVLSFELQTSDIVPAFPYIAPFSSMVPDICRVVKSFIIDSINYLSTSGDSNVLDTVMKYTDSLLIDVLNEVILKKISDTSIGVSKSMQLSADVVFLENACDFFVKTAAQLCGVLVPDPQANLQAKVVLKTSRDASYVALLGLVNTQLDEYMALPENVDWAPDEAPENGHDYMNEVTIYLESLLSTAQRILPLEALYKVGSGTLDHISNSIISSFLSDHVKRFNANAVIAFDMDLKMLEDFAEERFESTGLSEIYNKEGGFVAYLLEARQLVDLLMSSQPDNFMNAVIRQKSYNALDPKKVGVICEKFKDSPDSLFGSLTNRNTKTNLQKKSMDVLRRRLRDFG